jgi:flagellar biogenesis protein FliO
MKKTFLPLLMGLAHVSLASPTVGSNLKPEIIQVPQQNPKASSGIGISEMLQMLLALGVVLLFLRYLLPKWMTRLHTRIQSRPNSSIQIEDSATFGSARIYVVHVKGKTFLLCAAAQGVHCLADLTNAPETAKREEPEAPLFFEMLDQSRNSLQEESPNVTVDKESVWEKSGQIASDSQGNFNRPVRDLKTALERLERLVS